MNPLNNFEARHKALAKKAARKDASKPEATQDAQVIQLPLWKDFQRAAPACVLRSALFGVVKRGRRRYLEKQELAAWGEDSLTYTGLRLDQSDLDVWLELLHLSRETGLGKTVEFERYAFLRSMGRATGRQNWKWLESALSRMTATSVEIKSGKRRYFGSLIQEGSIDDETGRYVVVLNARLVELFNAGYTFQHDKKRRALQSDLAKWLSGYLESHSATVEHPHRIRVVALHQLCGSETAELYKFRQSLKSAAKQIQSQGIIRTWKISERDVFEVTK